MLLITPLLAKPQKSVEQAIEQATKDRLAIIYAWNEIAEGGWFMPCLDDPEGKFLEAIRQVVTEM